MSMYCLRDAVLEAKCDAIPGSELEVVDGLGGHQHGVGLRGQLADQLSRRAALKVAVLKSAGATIVDGSTP